jgi:hypothetical protein
VPPATRTPAAFITRQADSASSAVGQGGHAFFVVTPRPGLPDGCAAARP